MRTAVLLAWYSDCLLIRRLLLAAGLVSLRITSPRCRTHQTMVILSGVCCICGRGQLRLLHRRGLLCMLASLKG